MGKDPGMDGKAQAAEINPSWVSLDRLAQDPGPYGMSFGFDTAPLEHSIRECGLINAPCVTGNPSGQMDIVTGYRRVMAARALKWSGLPCRDLTPLNLSPLHLLLLNLNDNLGTRVFNDVEKAMALSRLLTHVPREEVLRRYMPLLHLPAKESFLTLLLAVEESKQEVKAAVAAGRLTLRNTKRLFAFPRDSRDRVLHWISDLMLNTNQQTQFMDIISDISTKEAKEIPDILTEKGMMALLADKDRNTPQKAKHVLEVLRQRRFPRLTESERVFQKRVAGLMLPNGVFIRHPPFFEGTGYQFEARFRNGAELRKMLGTLAEMEDLDNVGDPWEEGSG